MNTALLGSPTLSVIMPVWNGERYLREAIESILGQSFRDFEFLILDDGSTDSTPQILEEYTRNDPRIRILNLPHEGIVVALNRGVTESRGKWIARMDCDDIAHPTRLEKQVALMRRTDALLCHTQIRIIGDPQWITRLGRFIRSRALLALRMCFHCPIVHPTVMFRRDVFLALGGYAAAERHAEDYGLWGRMIDVGSIMGIAEPLLDLRVHAESISKQKADVQHALSEKIAKRHCQSFFKLDEAMASRAYEALSHRCAHPVREWIWFIFHCLPRLRWKSLEMWAWVVIRSWQIIRHSHKKTNHGAQ